MLTSAAGIRDILGCRSCVVQPDNVPVSVTESATESEQAELVLAQVRRAFAGVRLGNGTSLSQTVAIDACRPARAIARARALDPEVRWEDVSSERIIDLPPAGGFAFLDAEGARFHAPAFMRALLVEEAARVGNAFTFVYLFDNPADKRMSLFNTEQLAACAAFVRHMILFEHIDAWVGAAAHFDHFWAPRLTLRKHWTSAG